LKRHLEPRPGTLKFCNYIFCDFCWRGIDSVWVCRLEYEKKFENYRVPPWRLPCAFNFFV